MKNFLAASLLAGAVAVAGPAFAQGTAATAPMATKPAATSPMKSSGTDMGRTAKSKDCSMQADKQGLHGKARKAFRSKCKRGAA